MYYSIFAQACNINELTKIRLLKKFKTKYCCKKFGVWTKKRVNPIKILSVEEKFYFFPFATPAQRYNKLNSTDKGVVFDEFIL